MLGTVILYCTISGKGNKITWSFYKSLLTKVRAYCCLFCRSIFTNYKRIFFSQFHSLHHQGHIPFQLFTIILHIIQSYEKGEIMNTDFTILLSKWGCCYLLYLFSSLIAFMFKTNQPTYWASVRFCNYNVYTSALQLQTFFCLITQKKS